MRGRFLFQFAFRIRYLPYPYTYFIVLLIGAHEFELHLRGVPGERGVLDDSYSNLSHGFVVLTLEYDVFLWGYFYQVLYVASVLVLGNSRKSRHFEGHLYRQKCL